MRKMMQRKAVQCITFLVFYTLILLPTFAYSPYSNQELDELEREFIEQINSSDLIIRNPLANQYINHLGRLLAENGHLKAPYFFIVRSNDINAFAGPGGYIGINTQLILATASESELAAVMAHEMAHVRQHHLYRLIEHQKQMRVPMLATMLASIALGAINPAMGTGAAMATMGGFAQDSINYVRSNEKEADRIGIDMLIQSGEDPRGMASFFKKMQMNMRYYYTANIPAILRSHPLDEERIAEAENRSARLLRTVPIDPLNYQLFKELIRVAVADNPKFLLDYYKDKTAIPDRYGYALALIETNQYATAAKVLSSLMERDPNNIDFQLGMTKTEVGLKQYDAAIARLSALHNNYPTNYAVLMSFGESLIAANQSKAAVSLLIKGRRQFKSDLPMCHMLAEAQAKNREKAYAYFTEAQCQLLQGKSLIALQRLKLAKQLVKHNRLLAARIDAKIVEVKQNMN